MRITANLDMQQLAIDSALRMEYVLSSKSLTDAPRKSLSQLSVNSLPMTMADSPSRKLVWRPCPTDHLSHYQDSFVYVSKRMVK